MATQELIQQDKVKHNSFTRFQELKMNGLQKNASANQGDTSKFNKFYQVVVLSAAGTILSPAEPNTYFGFFNATQISGNLRLNGAFVPSSDAEIFEELKTFASNLIEKSKNLEQEFQRTIEKRFWDLI